MKFTIPASIEEATESLGGIGRLLHAKEWERAAIVASFVEVGEHGVGVRQAGKATSSLSPAEFAAIGITGLKSKDTVRRYVERWTEHRPAPRPGEVIDLDGLPEWPGGSTYEAGPAGAVKRIVDQPGTVAEALKDEGFREKVLAKADEETRKSVAKEVVADANVARAAASEMEDKHGMAVIDPTDPALAEVRRHGKEIAAAAESNRSSASAYSAWLAKITMDVADAKGTEWQVRGLRAARDLIDRTLAELEVNGGAADLTPEMFTGAAE
jgi:hypothetical protein